MLEACRSSGSTLTRASCWLILDPATVRYLREFPVPRRYRRLGGCISRVAGALIAAASPGVLLETLNLSVFNHDTAIASAAARMDQREGRR